MEPTNLAVMDRVLAAFTMIADAGIERIADEVMWLFFSLTTISFIWQHIRNMATDKAHPVGLLFGQLISIGFFVWILQQYTWITTQFYLSMIKLGLIAGGLDGVDPAKFGNPSSLMKIGMDVVKPLFDAMGTWGWLTGTNIIMLLSVIVVLAGFFIMSFQVFVAILEFKLGLIWCYLCFAMATLKQTSFATEKALGYIFASGMKLFALATITSIGAPVIKSFFTYSASPTYNESLSVAFGSLVLGMLTWFAPAKVAGVVSGGPSLGAGSLFSTAAAYGSLLGGAASMGATAGAAAVTGGKAAASFAKSSGITEALGGAIRSGAQNLANTEAGRTAIAGATIAAARAQGAAAAAMPSGPAGRALRMAGEGIQKAGNRVAQTFNDAAEERAVRAGRTGNGTGGASGKVSDKIAQPDGLTPEMKSNPVQAADALERMNSIERRYDSARTANNGATTAATEHSRAQGFRAIAHDIGAALQETNPAVSEKIGKELDRIEGAGQAMAKQGISPHENSGIQAQEYKNVVNRALNLDGGGGFDKAQMTTTMSPEGQKQNAAAVAALGVGSDIRAMAAKGMGNRDIMNSLGDKLKPLDAQAARLGQSSNAGTMKLQAIADYKSAAGIPNKGDAGFSQWANQEKRAASLARMAQAPAPEWAKNVRPFKAPNVRSMIPQGTERGGGITASGSTPNL
jgi:type IV secretion system protein TrbL